MFQYTKWSTTVGLYVFILSFSLWGRTHEYPKDEKYNSEQPKNAAQDV